MFALMADGWFMVSLVSRIEVRISIRIEKEIGSVESIDVRAVVVVHGMCVEHFAGVICIIARPLQPKWEKIIVEAAIDEFGISTIGWVNIGYIGVMCLATSP